MELSRTPFRGGATDKQGVRLRDQRKHRGERTMLRKLTIALAAAASLTAVAFAPTAASAKPWGGWGWGGYHHHFGGFGLGVGYVDDGCYVTRRVLTPYGYRFRTVNVCAY
jgi:hypothetical protein